MGSLVRRYLLFAGVLLAFGWLVHELSWRSAISFLGLLAGYIAHDFALHRKLRPRQKSDPHDEPLFRAFLRALPSGGGIQFLKQTNMAGFPFHRERLKQLENFADKWIGAEYEFNDEELEGKRAALRKTIEDYLEFLAANTWPTPLGLQSVPAEWEETNYERFKSVVGELHSRAKEIVLMHQELVGMGRKRFGAVPEE